MQRIFHCDRIQNTSLTPDEVLKRLSVYKWYRKTINIWNPWNTISYKYIHKLKISLKWSCFLWPTQYMSRKVVAMSRKPYLTMGQRAVAQTVQEFGLIHGTKTQWPVFRRMLSSLNRNYAKRLLWELKRRVNKDANLLGPRPLLGDFDAKTLWNKIFNKHYVESQLSDFVQREVSHQMSSEYTSWSGFVTGQVTLVMRRVSQYEWPIVGTDVATLLLIVFEANRTPMRCSWLAQQTPTWMDLRTGLRE